MSTAYRYCIHLAEVAPNLTGILVSGVTFVQRKSSGIQIPFPGASHRWCIVALDLAGSLSSFTTSPMHSVKSIQLCSWLTVRSMFTSDLKFSLKVRPSLAAVLKQLWRGCC